MARIRTIKPEFPQSESMGRVSREARLCFILLWTIADDSGRLRGNSRMLASLLYPYDDDSKTLMPLWLAELSDEGCIGCYKVESDSYVEILNWKKHQKIDKPSQSKIPAFDESSRILANPREVSSEDQGPRTEGSKDQGPEDRPSKARGGKAKRRNWTDVESYTEGTRQVVEELMAIWPKKQPDDRDINRDAFKMADRVQELLKNEKLNPDLLIRGAKAYLETRPKAWKAPQFFFGPGMDDEQPAWRPYVAALYRGTTQENK